MLTEGAYLCSKAVAPTMLKQKRGKIINISSNSGLITHPPCAPYELRGVEARDERGLTKAWRSEAWSIPWNVNRSLPGVDQDRHGRSHRPEVEKGDNQRRRPSNGTATQRRSANAALYLRRTSQIS